MADRNPIEVARDAMVCVRGEAILLTDKDEAWGSRLHRHADRLEAAINDLSLIIKEQRK